jgi:hypothetical protein
MRKVAPRLGWKARAGMTMPHALAIYEGMSKNPPLPQLVNFDGDDLVWCEAHYEILDSDRACAGLDEIAERSGNEWVVSNEKSLLATFSIQGRSLAIRCNSRERLQIWKDRLDQVLAGAARWRVDAVTDGEAALKDARSRPRSTNSAPQQLPSDVQEAMTQHIEGLMRSWIDEPVPALANKSPRQAVRSKRGKDQVTELLLGQERAFRNNPQMTDLSLQFVWDELGLRHPDQ